MSWFSLLNLLPTLYVWVVELCKAKTLSVYTETNVELKRLKTLQPPSLNKHNVGLSDFLIINLLYKSNVFCLSVKLI